MGSGAREERAKRDGLFAGEGTGVGYSKKFVPGRVKKAKMKPRKCYEQFGGGCQAALALSNNICSGTGNSQLMGTNFLCDLRAHDKAEWFPSCPPALPGPRG